MKVKPYLKSFTTEAYVPGEFLAGEAEFLDCSIGCNVFGASKMVLEAAREYDWSQIWRCPSPAYKELKGEIARFWSGYADIQTDQIQIGRGAIDILAGVNNIFLQEGAEVLGYSPQFMGYVSNIRACGAKYETVILRPEENFKFHAERLLERIRPEHSLIYIDNPNNPTGQVISLNAVEAVVRETRNKDVAVMVDEAYGDYMEQGDSAISLINKYDNLAVARSFDKGLGLCSLKIGYGILSVELSAYFNKVTPPFRTTAVGSYLAAVALSDRDFVASCRKKVKAEKGKLIRGLNEKNYLTSESYEHCPLLLVGHKNEEVDLKQELVSKGILTSPGTGFDNLSKNYVRVSLPARAEDFLVRLDRSS